MKRAAVEAASTPTRRTRPTTIPEGAELERIAPFYPPSRDTRYGSACGLRCPPRRGHRGFIGKSSRVASVRGGVGLASASDRMEGTEMGNHEVRNWFGSIVSFPSVVAEPGNVQDIVAIVQDEERYPSPVRAVGSNHSTTPCGVADDGTVVVMREMDRILN